MNPLSWQDDRYGGCVAHRADGRCSYVITTGPKVRGGFDLYSHRGGSVAQRPPRAARPPPNRRRSQGAGRAAFMP